MRRSSIEKLKYSVEVLDNEGFTITAREEQTKKVAKNTAIDLLTDTECIQAGMESIKIINNKNDDCVEHYFV